MRVTKVERHKMKEKKKNALGTETYRRLKTTEFKALFSQA